MPISKYRFSGQKGFTLMELMVGLFLAGMVFVMIMGLMGQTGKFAAFFNGTATSIEGVSDAVSQLNAIMPQVVRIRQCGCRGTVSTDLSDCVWSDSQPWYNPILNGGGSNSSNGGLGHLLLDGDFENFYGGDNSRMDTTQLLQTDLPATFGQGLGGCDDYDTVPAAFRRGCKQQLRIYYSAPERESGTTSSSTPSKAGRIAILLGNATAASKAIKIGDTDKNGLGGLGVTELSCGFNQSAGGATGSLFVLNFKIKARSTMLQNPGHSNYESWYPNDPGDANNYPDPDGKNYTAGLFRDLRLKYTFRNLGTRGVYHWRALSVRNCKKVGAAATNPEECCSMAISGGACTSCVPGGDSPPGGSPTECCSERMSGGDCI